MTEESDQERHPILGGPLLDLDGPEADIVRTDEGPKVRVMMEVTPGEWRERLFSLELWEERVDVEEGPGEEDVMSFVGHIPRQAFELGRENVAEIFLRRFEELWDGLTREAYRVGWWPDEAPGDIEEEELEELREEAEET